nr:MAG TPA: hypothetical protein [Bacteriophage sp.]
MFVACNTENCIRKRPTICAERPLFRFVRNKPFSYLSALYHIST